MIPLCQFRFGRFLMIGTLLAVLCQGGCGKTGPTLYPLSGEVKYKGQPVKAGTIQFEPAGEKKDPRGIRTAEIRDGRYELSRDKGVIGGSYNVIISPADGVPQEEMPHGRPLFPNSYLTKVDLPQEATTKNFDIPPQPGGK